MPHELNLETSQNARFVCNKNYTIMFFNLSNTVLKQALVAGPVAAIFNKHYSS